MSPGEAQLCKARRTLGAGERKQMGSLLAQEQQRCPNSEAINFLEILSEFKARLVFEHQFPSRFIVKSQFLLSLQIKLMQSSVTF